MKNFVKRMKSDYFDVFQWLVLNKKTINKHEYFDFPDYAGMPKKLSNGLSSALVDYIQDNWDAIKKARSVSRICDLILP